MRSRHDTGQMPGSWLRQLIVGAMALAVTSAIVVLPAAASAAAQDSPAITDRAPKAPAYPAPAKAAAPTPTKPAPTKPKPPKASGPATRPEPPREVVFGTPPVGGGLVPVRWSASPANGVTINRYQVMIGTTVVTSVLQKSRSLTANVSLAPGARTVSVRAVSTAGVPSVAVAKTMTVAMIPRISKITPLVSLDGRSVDIRYLVDTDIRRALPDRINVTVGTTVVTANPNQNSTVRVKLPTAWDGRSPLAASATPFAKGVSGLIRTVDIRSDALAPGSQSRVEFAPSFVVGSVSPATESLERSAASLLPISRDWRVFTTFGVASISAGAAPTSIANCPNSLTVRGSTMGVAPTPADSTLVVTSRVRVTLCNGTVIDAADRFSPADATDAWIPLSGSGFEQKQVSDAIGHDVTILRHSNTAATWGGGAAALAVMGESGPSGGVMEVTLNNVVVATVSTKSTKRTPRKVLWSTSNAAIGANGGRVSIRALSGSVVFDGISFLRNGYDATPVTVGRPGVVSDSSGHNAFPSLVRTTEGTLVAVWRNSTGHWDLTGTIQTSRSIDDGQTWTAPHTMLANSSVDYRDPSIWVAPNGNVVLSTYLKRATDGFILGSKILTSTNDGRSFTTVPSTEGVQGFIVAGHRGASITGPAVKAPDGSWLLPVSSLRQWNSMFFSAYVLRSPDGINFSGARLVMNGDSIGVNMDEPTLTVNPDGSVLMVVRNGIFTGARSTDSGATWTQEPRSFNAGSRVSLTTLADGRLLAVYRSWSGGGAELRVSTDAGATWSDPTTLVTGASRMNYAELVVSGPTTVTMVLSMEDSVSDRAQVTVRTVELRQPLQTHPGRI